MRAVQTGSDFRYFWLALASLLGAIVVTTFGSPSRSRPRAAVILSIAAFAIATLFAAGAALALGTRWNMGMLIVASAFGFCSAAGCALFACV